MPPVGAQNVDKRRGRCPLMIASVLNRIGKRMCGFTSRKAGSIHEAEELCCAKERRLRDPTESQRDRYRLSFPNQEYERMSLRLERAETIA